MIIYDKLWILMKDKGVSQYRLNKSGISHSTIARLKRNQIINTDTLDKLCKILGCNIGDIAECIDREYE